MAAYANSVQEGSDTGGSGNLTLIGPTSDKFFRFWKSGAREAGTVMAARIEHTSFDEVEICDLTLIDENTVSRGTIYASSNGDARVSFSPGRLLVSHVLLASVVDGFGAATEPQVANRIYAGPGSGADAMPTFRVMVEADIPNLNASKINAGDLAIARMQAALAAGGYPIKVTSFETTLNAGFGIAPSGASDRVLIRGASGANYFDNLIRITNLAGTQIFRASGDGRVSVGPETGQNVPFSVARASGGIPSGAVYIAVFTDPSGNLSFASQSMVSSAANFAFGANAFGNVFEMISPSNNGIVRVYQGNTTIGQQTQNGNPDKTLKVWNELATTGVTTFAVKAGAGQATTNLLEILASAAAGGGLLAAISSAGGGRFTGLRIDQALVTQTIVCDKTLTISVSGADYLVPVRAA